MGWKALPLRLRYVSWPSDAHTGGTRVLAAKLLLACSGCQSARGTPDAGRAVLRQSWSWGCDCGLGRWHSPVPKTGEPHVEGPKPPGCASKLTS